jgi:hypothetical protein
MGLIPLLICALTATSQPVETPKLFRERSLNCTTLAEAVNHYVALGEEAAIAALEGLATDRRTDFDRGHDINERIGWVSRILFLPKAAEPLRAPRCGGLGLPWRTMPLERWPLYPVAASGGCYFVLSEGYMLAGVAETPMNYLRFCRENGTFRKQPVPIPTRAEALKAVAALRETEAWKLIKWQDSGENFRYSISETWVWGFIKAQAETIPAD